MCTGHDNNGNDHDKRILKPMDGEMFSFNAGSIHDDDVKTINKFITFCRTIVKLKKENKQMKTHTLKTWPPYFHDIKYGKKTFDIRNNDRDFKEGDILILREWKPRGYSDVSPNEIVGDYTGESIQVKVTYVFEQPSGRSFGLIGNTVVLGIAPFNINDDHASNSEEKEKGIQMVKTAFEIAMFAAYSAGQAKYFKDTQDRNFKTWFDNNKMLDNLLSISEEYSNLTSKTDLLMLLKSVTEVFYVDDRTAGPLLRTQEKLMERIRDVVKKSLPKI